jgi:DNA-binding MarR family transcriptional regulator
MERPTGMPGLPALRQFTALQLAVLVLLVRRGSRGLDEVVTALAVPRAAVEREVAFLSSAGLVERRDERLDLRDAVRDEVAAALVEFGALEEGRR